MKIFYRGTAVILEHAELKERSQLLEMQTRQYRSLQEPLPVTELDMVSMLGNLMENAIDGCRTTKHSGKGTGLASIAAAAEKYGGLVQFSDSRSEFYVDIMLKI